MSGSKPQQAPARFLPPDRQQRSNRRSLWRPHRSGPARTNDRSTSDRPAPPRSIHRREGRPHQAAWRRNGRRPHHAVYSGGSGGHLDGNPSGRSRRAPGHTGAACRGLPYGSGIGAGITGNPRREQGRAM